MSFERRDLGDGGRVLVSTELERIGVVAAFTERTGGASRAPFASLNVSFSVGDERDAVLGNRRRIVEGLGLAPFAVAGLVHGSRTARVGPARAGAGFQDMRASIAGTDALSTTSPNLALCITWADCVPIVLASDLEPTVAAVHAGWRGIATGVVAGALRSFERPSRVVAVIGPSIGVDHYEVGEDVATAVRAVGDGEAVLVDGGGCLRMDLVGTVANLLRSAGVRRISDTGLCTACESDRFFSHRREGRTGRQAAVAARVAA